MRSTASPLSVYLMGTTLALAGASGWASEVRGQIIMCATAERREAIRGAWWIASIFANRYLREWRRSFDTIQPDSLRPSDREFDRLSAEYEEVLRQFDERGIITCSNNISVCKGYQKLVGRASKGRLRILLCYDNILPGDRCDLVGVLSHETAHIAGFPVSEDHRGEAGQSDPVYVFRRTVERMCRSWAEAYDIPNPSMPGS